MSDQAPAPGGYLAVLSKGGKVHGVWKGRTVCGIDVRKAMAPRPGQGFCVSCEKVAKRRLAFRAELSQASDDHRVILKALNRYEDPCTVADVRRRIPRYRRRARIIVASTLESMAHAGWVWKIGGRFQLRASVRRELHMHRPKVRRRKARVTRRLTGTFVDDVLNAPRPRWWSRIPLPSWVRPSPLPDGVPRASWSWRLRTAPRRFWSWLKRRRASA